MSQRTHYVDADSRAVQRVRGSSGPLEAELMWETFTVGDHTSPSFIETVSGAALLCMRQCRVVTSGCGRGVRLGSIIMSEAEVATKYWILNFRLKL